MQIGEDMKTIHCKQIEDACYTLVQKACSSITTSCQMAMQKAWQQEENSSAKFALEILLQNANLAQTENLPICQDTGFAIFFLKIGRKVYIDGNVEEAIQNAVRRAYNDFYLRKSICDPITRVNTTDNTPANIHFAFVDGESIEIVFMPKGFGSENMSKLYMLTPAQGKQGILDAILSTVKAAGSNPCPPIIVGVGIGGTFDSAPLLAKKALMRAVGSHNTRADILQLEVEALQKINALGIGAQGFGGNTTALAVHIEVAPTHIAGLPVAINIQCHCMRMAKTTIF